MIAYPIGTMCGMFDFHYSLFGQEKIYTAASCGVLTHSGINNLFGMYVYFRKAVWNWRLARRRKRLAA